MKTKIYVAHHKEGFHFFNEVFTPIHVGSIGSAIKLDILSDSSGENISAKNQFYCELTSIYWAWKNDLTSDFIGFCHYRRYFSNKGLPVFQAMKLRVKYLYYKCFGGLFNNQKTFVSINQNFIDNIGDFDKSIVDFTEFLKTNVKPIIATYPIFFSNRNVEDWWSIIGESYVNELKVIIRSKYPDYVDTMNHVMCNNQISICNMVILRRDIFNEYCSFLFDVLAEHEKLNINVNDNFSGLPYKGYLRVLGILGEVLTYIFIKQYEKMHQLNIHYVYNSKISDKILLRDNNT